MSDHLQVWLDSDLAAPALVGVLANDRGQVRFTYDAAWLADPGAFSIDPALPLGTGTFYPPAGQGNFGVFLDASPDRWGQTLMRRREALAARDEGRAPRELYAWDFLLGVQDATRQGALRLREEDQQQFLGAQTLAAPPVTSLRELESVARELSNRRIEDLGMLRRWLATLLSPGASLGGARPKASFRDSDGSLWIAKFPAFDDDRDVGAWEAIARQMAADARVEISPAYARIFNGPYHTFCTKRFDRAGEARIFYSSAMTLLQRQESDGASYLEIAQLLRQAGNPATVASDLEQLFRRVLFSVAAGNRDDHLRNHGFIRKAGGWSLAPAFDINPNVERSPEHTLNIDDSDNRPSIALAMSTADFYKVSPARAAEICEEVLKAIDPWRALARSQGISAADIALTELAFAPHTEARAAGAGALAGAATPMASRRSRRRIRLPNRRP